LAFPKIFENPSGNIIVSKEKISKKLNSTPFHPAPTTYQPSLKCTRMIPAISTNMVTIDASFIYLLNNRQKAATRCDNLIAMLLVHPLDRNLFGSGINYQNH
jgi:hypothetical protein